MIKQVLLRRNFLLLAMGQIISQLGDKLFHMIVISLVGHCAHSLAKMLFFMALPACFTPIAGAYTDRWDRRRVMMITDILRAIIILFIISQYDKIIIIYLLIFLLFTASKFFAPARSAILPQLVEKHQLTAANSISISSIMLTTVVSIAIGGVIIQRIGEQSALFINSLTYLLSCVCIFFIFINNNNKNKNNSSVNSSILEQLKDGLRLIIKKRLISICSIFGVLCVVLASLYILGIAYLRGICGLSMKQLGILGALLGLGIMIGMISIAKIDRKIKRSYIILSAFMVLGISIFLLPFTKNIFYLAGVIFLGGIVTPIIPTIVYTIIHELCPDDYYGRVFASLDLLGNLSFLLSTVIVGILSCYMNSPEMLKWIGLLVIFYGIAILLHSKIYKFYPR